MSEHELSVERLRTTSDISTRVPFTQTRTVGTHRLAVCVDGRGSLMRRGFLAPEEQGLQMEQQVSTISVGNG